ncbi:unnamed protein product [Penicillium nalgiovense]|uniref:Uncharacterized protein n=1 Tax=Penicillium nalgiovense TaxID=60175 RepID=A0A9W4MPR0_PENNA|nr:unnamed protein product [Penicillium nalgiovense]CAG7976094.1 unnamed protein product [Penicillium nalgiovense]CAG7979710.1 unnamed protein product [Penicillium nalgiovense]CAG7993585.1 unnamed protein product [Penicillium nalgiovense]CAG7997158.1 unnamed protein product [Penicillium nalgiovense]
MQWSALLKQTPNSLPLGPSFIGSLSQHILTTCTNDTNLIQHGPNVHTVPVPFAGFWAAPGQVHTPSTSNDDAQEEEE